MGKFGRKLKRARCLSGRIRYETRGKVMAAQRDTYKTFGEQRDAVFCYLCGAFHLEKVKK